MSELVPLLFALLFVGILVLGVVGLFVGIFVVAKRRARRAEAAWIEVQERLGLSRMTQPPEMRGTVDGIDVVVDITTTEWTSHGAGYASRRRVPWTRVRAALAQPVAFEVRGPGWKGSGAAPGSPRPTGDAAFDQRYRFTAPADVELSQSLHRALLEADPPVHVTGEIVMWIKFGNVHDTDLLLRAIRSCVSVAAALRV